MLWFYLYPFPVSQWIVILLRFLLVIREVQAELSPSIPRLVIVISRSYSGDPSVGHACGVQDSSNPSDGLDFTGFRTKGFILTNAWSCHYSYLTFFFLYVKHQSQHFMAVTPFRRTTFIYKIFGQVAVLSYLIQTGGSPWLRGSANYSGRSGFGSFCSDFNSTSLNQQQCLILHSLLNFWLT